jgi:hypothetical protein
MAKPEVERRGRGGRRDFHHREHREHIGFNTVKSAHADSFFNAEVAEVAEGRASIERADRES